jgi:hypothetical protein
MAGLAVLTGSQQAQGKHGKECGGMQPEIVDRLEFPGIVVADC